MKVGKKSMYHYGGSLDPHIICKMNMMKSRRNVLILRLKERFIFHWFFFWSTHFFWEHLTGIPLWSVLPATVIVAGLMTSRKFRNHSKILITFSHYCNFLASAHATKKIYFTA